MSKTGRKTITVNKRPIVGKVRFGTGNFEIVGPYEKPTRAPDSDNIMEHIAWAIHGGSTLYRKGTSRRERVARWSAYVGDPNRAWTMRLRINGKDVPRFAGLSTLHSAIKAHVTGDLVTYRKSLLLIADSVSGETVAEIDLSEP